MIYRIYRRNHRPDIEMYIGILLAICDCFREFWSNFVDFKDLEQFRSVLKDYRSGFENFRAIRERYREFWQIFEQF